MYIGYKIIHVHMLSPVIAVAGGIIVRNRDYE